MRIAFIVNGDLETLSGGFRYDRILVEYLQEQGDTVDVVKLPRSAYPVSVLQNFTCGGWRSCRAPLYDIIVQDELAHASLFLSNRILKKKSPVPVVGLVHHLRQLERGPLKKNIAARELENRYLRTLDGIIGVSRTALASARERMAGNVPNIIAYPGHDLPGPALTELEIMERAFQPGPLRILFAGALIRRKNLHTLIGALSRLGGQEWHLDIAGDLEAEPSYVRRIIQLVISAGLVPRVSIHGPVTDSELHALFRSAHLFVMPSHYEGLGIAYLQAMGYGIPSIATFNGGASEIVHSGRNGFVVDPGRGAEIARRVEQMCRNREYLFRLSLAAAHAHRRFPSWKETCGRVRSFLYGIAGKKPAPGKTAEIPAPGFSTAMRQS